MHTEPSPYDSKHIWRVGDRVTWDAAAFGLIKAPQLLGARIVSLGPKQVQIEVAYKPAYRQCHETAIRWVSPLELRPRLMPSAGLHEPDMATAYGIEVSHAPHFNNRSLLYGTLNGVEVGMPCSTPEQARAEAMVALRSAATAIQLEEFVRTTDGGSLDPVRARFREKTVALLPRLHETQKILLDTIEEDEDSLRDWARGVAGDNDDGSHFFFDPEVGTWKHEARYPVENLMHKNCFASRQAAYDWLAREISNFIEDGDADRAQLYRSLIFEPTNDPIIAGEVGGLATPWDGWHRTAIALASGAKTLPAVIGRPELGVAPRVASSGFAPGAAY